MNDTVKDITMPTPDIDRELLVILNERMEKLLITLDKADFPTRCAVHEQRHLEVSNRVAALESKFWWIITTVVGSAITAVSSLVMVIMRKIGLI